MGRPLQGEIRQCQKCHKNIRVAPSAIKRGKGKFCSKDCANADKSVTRHCLICNRQFIEYKTRIVENRGKFCSRSCYEQDWSKRIPGWNKGQSATWAIGNIYRKGKTNPNPHKMIAEENHNWKNGITVGKENRRIYFQVKAMERLSRKKKAFGSYTVDEWKNLKIKYSNTCLRCKKKEPEIFLTQDHIIPLSKGGNNTIENIQPLCKLCNSIKNTKTIDYRM